MTRMPGQFRRAIWLAAAPLALWPALALAQPVVQALPDAATLQLNEAIRALARDPRSLTALLAAAEAATALDNIDAATGFVLRAEAIAPSDGRVIAARAALLVHQRQPVAALGLFAEAELQGALALSHVAERGLAHDLVGDNAKAQEDYATALSASTDPVVIRRLALSQAIAGDQRASEATLLPLLQRRDLAAYRTRAFALAILGKPDEAVSIAETMLPEQLSSRMAPYLRYMPRLTRAQQAAAANLGVFPQAAQIGRDDPALAAYATPQAVRPGNQEAGARLVPSGEPLGRREAVAVAIAPPPPQTVAQVPPEPIETAPEPVVETPPEPEIVFVANEEPAAEPQAQPPVVVATATDEMGPPVSAPAADERAPSPADLASAFADFSLPARPVVTEGAVDITRITPRRETPQVAAAPAAKPTPPPKPVIPSRHWVQVATGRDTGALAFDWRRIKREAGGLLDRPAPHTAKWGQTNRLVAGPFPSAREADALIAKLKDKKIDSFRFTSAQGEEVKPLG